MTHRRHNRRSQKGETLVETLAAILIVSLTAVLLLFATTSATRLEQTAAQQQEALNEQIEYAEQHTTDEDGVSEGSITITVVDEQAASSSTESYEVNYFGGDILAAYRSNE